MGVFVWEERIIPTTNLLSGLATSKIIFLKN